MNPKELSRQLREGEGGFLPQRRAVVTLSLLAEAALSIISLYQTGLIKHVPEPPLPGFNADKVNASPDAYATLNMPDGPLGMASYAVTIMLAATGGKDRVEQNPWIPLALAGKVVFDTVTAVKLTLDQARKQHAFCLYCLSTSAVTFVTVPLIIPETTAALKRVLAER